MKKLSLPALAAMLCASLFLSCYSELELPLSPDDKFSSSVLKSSSSGPKNSSGGSSSSSLVNETTFTDERDGQTYKVVKIGTQTWMAENLNFNATGSKCYNDQQAICAEYGKLYNWAAATANTTCPAGWHLPTKAEWEKIVGSTSTMRETAGRTLKTTEKDGTDDYGFTALMGGYCNSDGYFSMMGREGIWWTATEDNKSEAYLLTMFNDNESAQLSYDLKVDFYSVRCVK
jgi:uncharacterized protein (TIGR02145 family)